MRSSHCGVGHLEIGKRMRMPSRDFAPIGVRQDSAPIARTANAPRRRDRIDERDPTAAKRRRDRSAPPLRGGERIAQGGKRRPSQIALGTATPSAARGHEPIRESELRDASSTITSTASGAASRMSSATDSFSPHPACRETYPNDTLEYANQFRGAMPFRRAPA